MSNCKRPFAIITLVLALLSFVFSLSPPTRAAPVVNDVGVGWQVPLPQGNHLYGVWGSYCNDVFAVGDCGTILHYDGTSWSGMGNSTTKHLYGVWGTSHSDVFAVGDNGTILHYDGFAWSNMTNIDATDKPLWGVWGTFSDNVYAVGSGGTIVHYDGSIWSPVESGSTKTLRDIWGTSANDFFVTGWGGTILHCNSTHCTPMDSGIDKDINGVWGSSPDNVYAVGGSGFIVHYDGTSWTPTNVGDDVWMYDVWGSSADDVFATAGQGKHILHYDGNEEGTWAAMNSSDTTTHVSGIWGSGPDDVFAVGDCGIIQHYDGTSWTLMTSRLIRNSANQMADLRAVHGTSSSDVFAVGAAGRQIMRYDGTSWQAQDCGSVQSFYDVWCNTSSDVYAVGANGMIFHYDGASWDQMSGPTTKTLTGVWGCLTNIFAVGLDGTVLHNDGSPGSDEWTEVDTGDERSLNAVWGTSANDVYAVGTYKGPLTSVILHYDGTGWTAMDTGLWYSMTDIWGTASDSIYVCGEGGTLLHYDGSDWTPIDTGTSRDFTAIWGSSDSDIFLLTDSASTEEDVLHYTGDEWRWEDAGTHHTLNDIWGTSATDVFAVGDSGTILHYLERTIISVIPNHANQGETLNVVVTGSDFAGMTNISFGDGITVNSFTSTSTWIDANITIGAAAATGARDVTVEMPTGDVTLAGGFTVTGPPTITSVSPTFGRQGQTLDVVISGSNFAAATNITFGDGITVNYFVINDSSQITANITVAADAATVSRNVGVTTPGGTHTLVTGFLVASPEPTITTVSPPSAEQGCTLYVNITGTRFEEPANVSFGAGIDVNSVVVRGSTSITAGVSIDRDAAPGSRDVTVLTLGGMATLTDGFTVDQAAPSITSINPVQGNQGASLDVTITGHSFLGATDVSFGDGITVTAFTNTSSTEITASITVGADATLGTRDVTVTTPIDTDTLAAGFTVLPPAPTITSVSPSKGNQGESIDLTITGTNFSEVEDVSFGAGITVASFGMDSSTQITASITIAADATLGARSISVTTPGGVGMLSEGFAVTAPPTISGVDPASGERGETLNVTITGIVFTGVTDVSFGTGITVTDFTVDSGVQITATISIDADTATGTRDVSVTTEAGTGTLVSGFTVIAALSLEPTVIGVTPNSAEQGETLRVTITGTNFGGTDVSFGDDVTVSYFTVDSATQITATIVVAADAVPGARDVSVTTSAGTGTLADGFTVEEKAEEDEGEAGGCSCGSIRRGVPVSTVLIGWTVVGLCWGSGYYLVRKVSRRTRK